MAEGPGPPTASAAAALQSTANWQHAVLSRKSADVATALAANRLAGILAGHLKARGIIGQPVFEQATNYAVGVTEYARVEHFVTAVLTKTKCNPQCYHDFIEVLKLDGIRPDTEAACSYLPTAAMPPTAGATTGSSVGEVLIMNRGKPRELSTMPCLGRPFQLGMLYDCCSDQLVVSTALWNEETLRQALDSIPQNLSRFEIIADNSTESKLSKLGVDKNLKLSFLAGLVNVSGAAAYLKDQTSSENQVRINVRYQSTARINQLAIEKLGNLDNPDVLKNTTATHFVSGILYGADAIFVFDQEVSHDEKVHDSHRFMKAMVELLPAICTHGNAALDISDTDKRKVQKFHCKLYCDLVLPKNPNTFDGVVKLCETLPTLLSESGFPQKVWLCPLSKLNSKVTPITREISAEVVTQTQNFMEATLKLEMKTSDLMNSEVCTSFVAIKEQLSCFKRRITEYKVDFANNLATLIPKVRGGIEEEDELSQLFRKKDASPFSHECLSSWVQGKISEVKVLRKYLSRMKDFEFAFSPGDMDSVVSDPEYNLVISFTFTTAGQCDQYLERMTAYLQPHATGQEMINPPTPWYNNSKILSNMKVQTRLFESFAKANEQAKETKFVVTSSSDELSEEGAVIQLYEDCKKEIFEPPSEPGKPSTTSVTHNCIQVNWSKPKNGSQNVQFYNIFYCDLSSSPEQWKAEQTSSAKDSITVKDLNPQKKYCFKVQAVCKAGFSEVSKVCEPIQTGLVSVAPGKPIVSSKSHNSIKLQWSKAQYGEHNVDCYTISCHETKDSPELEFKTVKTEGETQSATVSGLDPQTAYCFKVRAEFKNAASLVSDISDPIQTYPVPVPPGKPIASNVTHNSIQLEWSEAQCEGHNIEFYTVCYRKQIDQPAAELENWKQTKTTNHHAAILISNLAAQTAYSFKVHADFSGGITLVSETSAPLQTYPAPVPPCKPIISCVTHNSIHLEWSKPQYNEDKVDCYTIFYREIDPPNQEQAWKEVITDPIHKESVAVSCLAPDRKYSFKVCAKFESGMGLHSNSTDPVQTYPAPVAPGKPIAPNVTHNSVHLQWSEPQYGGQSVDFYTVFYCDVNDPLKQWKEVRLDSPKQPVTVDNLASETVYSFKVQAHFKADHICSDVSDPIETDPHPIPPGKPIASNVTHNSIQLKWSKAQCAGRNAEFYTISYHETLDSKPKWKESKTKCATECAILSDLAAQTQYSIKVQAKFKTGTSLDSEISDPIQTYPVPVPPGKPIVSNVTHSSVHLEQAQFKAYPICSESSDPIQTQSPLVPPGKPTASSIAYNSIQLKWSKAQYRRQSVKFYSVLYREIKDSSGHWKEIKATDEEFVTVTNLTPKMAYSFKVCATFKDGMRIDSEISDRIQTVSPPVPPGKPFASSRTHNSVQLEWVKPYHEAKMFHCYTVFYCKSKNKKGNWKELEGICEEFVLVQGLTPQTEYSFRVYAVFSDDTLKSEVSDPISTHHASVIPGRPYPFSVTHNSVELQWPKPDYGAENIEFYTVSYREMKGLLNPWQERKSEGAIESITISGLGAEKEYCFNIRAELKPCDLTSGTSETSEPIKTKDRIALRMLSENPTKEGPLEFHKLSMVEQMSDETNRIKKCVISEHRPCIPSQHKVLLVVGAAGAGKSTLINGMINYILKVEWKDSFRYKLITEEEQQTQAKSQTKWITAYTLPKMEGSPIPYTLTVIDTPGFGDTEGLIRDMEITKQIKEFFSMRCQDGIDHVDGVGFVTQSALACLTVTQQYIFDAILSIFGSEVADNIFIMVTFADGHTPPVMAAVIKDAVFPFCKFYKFNNSALFASNDVEADDENPESVNLDKMFWKMGAVSFKKFFAELYKAKPVSLQLTSEVLKERERLEITISGLHSQIRCGLANIEEMRKEEEVLRQHEADIATNKDFNYEVDTPKQRKVDLQGKGIYVTNCLQCNYTCHPDCMIPKDEHKRKCATMDRQGFCTVCTKKCKWDQHVNNPYRYEEYVVHEVRTADELKKKYDQAVAGKTKNESMMIGIDNQLKDCHTQVLTIIKRVQRCIRLLDECNSKTNPRTEVDFWDLLIESENHQADPGSSHRVQYYKSAKEQAVIRQHLQTEDVVADLDAGQENPQYTSWYARFKY